MVGCLQFGAGSAGWGAFIRLARDYWSGTEPGSPAESPAGVILLQVRLPRLLLAGIVGGSLAVAGVGLQALLRNPLADPYVLGISSGATLGVSTAILMGLGSSMLAVSVLPLCGMLGGLLSIVVVYRVAASHGHLPVHTLLLAGVIVNAIGSAFVLLVTSLLAPTRSFGVLLWLMGNLSLTDYRTVLVLSLYIAAGVMVLWRQAGALNLLTLGEEPAGTLGVDVESVKRRLFLASSLMTGAVVSVSGMIGFVGMVVPHGLRLTVGADHRVLLPASFFMGGAFLMAADTLARTMLAPLEIPVGVVTALIGGPLFILLLRANRGRRGLL
jgi:iron complex transport system permease protein